MGAGRALSAVYLDASAVVKLLVSEPETDALDRFLVERPLRVSSQILEVELACVCHRQELPPTEASELLAGIRLLPLTPAVLRAACQPFAPPQRALDALHLASAASVREHIDSFVSYDSEQLAAAVALGWIVEHPGRALAP